MPYAPLEIKTNFHNRDMDGHHSGSWGTTAKYIKLWSSCLDVFYLFTTGITPCFGASVLFIPIITLSSFCSSCFWTLSCSLKTASVICDFNHDQNPVKTDIRAEETYAVRTSELVIYGASCQTAYSPAKPMFLAIHGHVWRSRKQRCVPYRNLWAVPTGLKI